MVFTSPTLFPRCPRVEPNFGDVLFHRSATVSQTSRSSVDIAAADASRTAALRNIQPSALWSACVGSRPAGRFDGSGAGDGNYAASGGCFWSFQSIFEENGRFSAKSGPSPTKRGAPQTILVAPQIILDASKIILVASKTVLVASLFDLDAPQTILDASKIERDASLLSGVSPLLAGFSPFLSGGTPPAAGGGSLLTDVAPL